MAGSGHGSGFCCPMPTRSVEMAGAAPATSAAPSVAGDLDLFADVSPIAGLLHATPRIGVLRIAHLRHIGGAVLRLANGVHVDRIDPAAQRAAPRIGVAP